MRQILSLPISQATVFIFLPQVATQPATLKKGNKGEKKLNLIKTDELELI
jgi:hypothetical protein